VSDCLFCKIVNGEVPGDIVYQDDKLIVFKDLYPKAETHLLVIPKEHYTDLIDIAEKNPETLSYMMNNIPLIAQKLNLNNGFRTIINTGKGSGQIIFHIHAHIMAGNNLPGF